MAQVEVTSDAERLGREIAAAARLIASGIPKALARATQIVEAHAARAHLSGPTGAATLRSRSGQLRGSLARRVCTAATTSSSLVDGRSALSASVTSTHSALDAAPTPGERL